MVLQRAPSSANCALDVSALIRDVNSNAKLECDAASKEQPGGLSQALEAEGMQQTSRSATPSRLTTRLHVWITPSCTLLSVSSSLQLTPSIAVIEASFIEVQSSGTACSLNTAPSAPFRMLSAQTAAMLPCSSHCAPRAAAARALLSTGRQACALRSLPRQPCRSICRQTVCAAQAAEVGAERSAIILCVLLKRAV